MPAKKAFSLKVRDDGVAVITIDVPGESMNTLKDSFADEAAVVFKDVNKNPNVKAAVIISGKPDSFIAGADINMLASAKTAADVTKISRDAQKFMDSMAASTKPLVAAINGVALGGGLELAMACHARVASDNPKTAVGLPEVMLGILPGACGTQRLPRLIGAAKALDLMMTGRQVKGPQAKKMGILDEIVPAAILLESACEYALKLVGERKHKKTLQERVKDTLQWAATAEGAQTIALEKNPAGRKVLFGQAKKQLLKKTLGNYPAPEKILEVVEIGLAKGYEAGLKAEAEAFGQLAKTPESKQLMGIYFATTDLKKETFVKSKKKIEPAPISKVGILGGGLMGAGIAFVTVDKADADVRIKDIRDDGIRAAIGHIDAEYKKRVSRKRMSPADKRKAMSRFTGTLDYSGFNNVDLVIEAVFEDMKLKHQMVKDIEAITPDTTIFATNTSSLPLTEIAKASKRPGNLIGLHYFSPVEKMPLLEIVVHDKTSEETIVTSVEFGKKQGKTVIVVKDCAGFFVNRILGPYMNEAAWIGMEGVPFELLDKAATQFGWPVGPITLLDEVGMDVGGKVGQVLEKAYGARFATPGTTDKFLADKRLGRKTKKGFYLYEGVKKGEKKIDPAVYDLVGVKPTNTNVNLEELAIRMTLPFANEAVRALDEGIVQEPMHGDIGSIFGVGFPPFRGGPFRWLDAMGLQNAVDKLKALEDKHGARFTPAEDLVARAKKNKTFYKS